MKFWMITSLGQHEILENLMKLGASNKIAMPTNMALNPKLVETGTRRATLNLKLLEVGLIARKRLSMACDGGDGFCSCGS